MSTPGDAPPSAPPLRLRIPEPAIRCGEPLTSAALHISRAGEVRRPDLDEEFHSLAPLCEQMIRVLDDDGKAVGPWVGTAQRGRDVAPACAT